MAVHAAAQYFEIRIIVHQDDGTVHTYNGGTNGHTVNIGFSKRYKHYYSVKDNDNLTTHTIDPEALLNDDEFAEDILGGGGDETDSAPRHNSRSSSALRHPPSRKLPTSRGYQAWSQAETMRLLQMREASYSWREIQAAFPKRTSVSIRSHWSKSIVGTFVVQHNTLTNKT